MSFVVKAFQPSGILDGQDLRTDATHGRGARPCAPTDGGSKVNLRKS
jgi:hypothetical protein